MHVETIAGTRISEHRKFLFKQMPTAPALAQLLRKYYEMGSTGANKMGSTGANKMGSTGANKMGSTGANKMGSTGVNLSYC